MSEEKSMYDSLLELCNEVAALDANHICCRPDLGPFSFENLVVHVAGFISAAQLIKDHLSTNTPNSLLEKTTEKFQTYLGQVNQLTEFKPDSVDNPKARVNEIENKIQGHLKNHLELLQNEVIPALGFYFLKEEIKNQRSTLLVDEIEERLKQAKGAAQEIEDARDAAKQSVGKLVV